MLFVVCVQWLALPHLLLCLFSVPLDRVECFTLAGILFVIIPNKRFFFHAGLCSAIYHPPRAGNSITAVPDGYFNALPNLTDIDLSFNEGVCSHCHLQANELIVVCGPGLLRLDEGVGFLQQLQKLRVQGAAISFPSIRCQQPRMLFTFFRLPVAARSAAGNRDAGTVHPARLLLARASISQHWHFGSRRSASEAAASGCTARRRASHSSTR